MIKYRFTNMKIVEPYAVLVLRIPGGNRLEGMYGPGSGLACLFHGDGKGSACHLFSFGGDTPESRLAGTLGASGADTRHVRACLSGILRRLDWGRFYVDRLTGCIACGVAYPIPPGGLQYGDASLERFCTHAWQTRLKYRGALSRLTRPMHDAGAADRYNRDTPGRAGLKDKREETPGRE